jgi:hypothetical protein
MGLFKQNFTWFDLKKLLGSMLPRPDGATITPRKCKSPRMDLGNNGQSKIETGRLLS